MREIARTLGCAPSTITRELIRNSCDGLYASKSAEGCAAKRRMQARPAPRLHKESILFGIVHHLLCIRWSTEQISMTLSATYPKGHEHRASEETIYNCIYAQPVGELKRDLIKALRQAHNKRVPCSKGQDRRGPIRDMVSIHVRPPEIEDRQFPGHWKGDLIKGDSNGSAVGTLVERTSRLLMLVKLPEVKPASALNVLQGFMNKLLNNALPLRLSMTKPQGREMAMYKELSKRTGIAVYVCDPHSLWPRGSNENMNGLVRQFLPKGTDLSVYSQVELDAIADKFNNRPRKGLGGTIAAVCLP